MEQIAATFSEKPLVIPEVCLMAPGVWTGTDNRPTEFTSEQIKRGYVNTSWDSMNLFLDHRDGDMSGLAFWAGLIKNPYVKENGALFGDVEIWHPLMKVAFKEAKANIAVSATTNGLVTNVENGVDKYRVDSYRSFSLVDSPGCKISWLPKNFSGKSGELIINCGEISGEKIMKAVKEFSNHTQEGVSKPSEEVSSSKHSENTIQKEVNEMSEQKEKETAEEEKAESESKEESEDVKKLSSRVDKLSKNFDSLSESIKTLTGIVQKSFAEGEEESKEEATEEVEESKEKPESEKAEEKEEEPEEESESEKELANTKKELAALKDKVKASEKSSPKEFASGSTDNVDAGMMNVLRHRHGYA